MTKTLHIPKTELVPFSPVRLVVACLPKRWRDATVDGVPDAGEPPGMPLACGMRWLPIIDLESGLIAGWPAKRTVKVEYCPEPASRYWLQDANGDMIRWRHDYPPPFLAARRNFQGMFIDLSIAGDGRIEGWQWPDLFADDWRLETV